MRQLNLVKAPSPILKQISAPVTKFDRKLVELAGAMHYWMRIWNGIGLSAVQVARPIQLITINTVPEGGEKLTIVNPVILSMSEDMMRHNEGCLSFPNEFVINERPNTVTIRYQSVSGESHTKELSGITAFCFLHEYDHLEGRTLLDIKTNICDTENKEQ